MARAFLPERGRYVALLDEDERGVLWGLMQQTRLLLSPDVEATGDVFADLVASMGLSLSALDTTSDAAAQQDSSSNAELPERDPALDRLLPTAHRGDDEIAAEFRHLTEQGLRQRKSGNLDLALARVRDARKDRVVLDQTDAPAFLMALTDVRLLLGERLGMRTDDDVEALHEALEEADEEGPLVHAVAWYDFLTWLQETLTHALLGGEVGDYASMVDEEDARERGEDGRRGDGGQRGKPV